jgi:hypothetical protein
MMLVDSLLEREKKSSVATISLGEQKDDDQEIQSGDNFNDIEECSESPEATRHFKKDENDLIDFNQRRRSIFHNPDKEINFHNHGADMKFDVTLGLSPILRENLNNTTDENYDRMCTTFNTFGSPNWLDNNEDRIKDKTDIDDDEMILPDFNDYNPAYESEDIEDTIIEELPEFCPNTFENLSISSKNEDDCTDDKTEISRKSRERRHKLKQTTVTFYYDSDEEIKDTSDSDSPIDVRITCTYILIYIYMFMYVNTYIYMYLYILM